ncbi:hypothetical protein [Glutamicibacter sp. AOP3-A1-12]|uniref:hypothetical protein n=1 Tax=Glutamicibacter sp. AOP3-A1-12 TaxID=3457701 RepID=UPI00403355BE
MGSVSDAGPGVCGVAFWMMTMMIDIFGGWLYALFGGGCVPEIIWWQEFVVVSFDGQRSAADGY